MNEYFGLLTWTAAKQREVKKFPYIQALQSVTKYIISIAILLAVRWKIKNKEVYPIENILTCYETER